MANEQFYPAGSLTGLNAAVNGQNVQWQQPQPQMMNPDGSGSLTQLMQLMMQPRQQQQAAPLNLQQLLAPVPTHDSSANISNGGSLFANPNFYNAQGQRTGAGSPLQGLYGGGTITSAPPTVTSAMLQTPGFHAPGVAVPGQVTMPGVYANGQQQLPNGMMPPKPMQQHPLQGLFNTPGMQA